ncbi:homologous recombination OB-fold protein-like [Onthophagus taurus]|uniref:homologous recombination OB-fold protein-like n=1 Tax=Onthophagus taurus TaxID=166361 RepID=UPI0039BEB855
MKTPKIIKRKFPGPAGLLLPEKENQISSQTVLCSQSTSNTFSDGTWLEMMDDLNQNNHGYLLDKYNIGWVINNSKIINRKIPFLAVKIKLLELIGKKPNFILCDPTGEIGGIISEELYERFSEFLTINSVFILKGCSLLTMSPIKRYLIITENNLLKIYNLFNNSVMKKSDDLQIITVNKFNYDDFDEEIDSPPPKKFKSIQIKEDSASVVILSQSTQKDINAVRDALNDIDFDDF